MLTRALECSYRDPERAQLISAGSEILFVRHDSVLSLVLFCFVCGSLVKNCNSVCVYLAHKLEGKKIWKIIILCSTWVFIGIDLKEKALEWKSQAPLKREYNYFSLKIKTPCISLGQWSEKMPLWTGQDKTELLRGCRLTSSPVWGAGEETT